MSLPHIMLVKWRETDAEVEYCVECRDFNPDTRWEVVGGVILTPKMRIYRFHPTAIWRKKRVLPPYLYGLEQPERVAEIRAAYRGYGFGAWGEAVHQCAVALMREHVYPERLAYRWDILWEGLTGRPPDSAEKSPEAAPVAAIRAFPIVAPDP